jgi:arabinose-5-phosphate isomerase
MSNDIAVAQGVLRLEARALEALALAIDSKFQAAVELMLHCRGRVIVTGIGKSGHVARKIVATLASTGTPAHFVHPAEAAHGDMGMIARGDVVLMLSNSGKAPELREVIHHVKRFDVPLIAMTSNAASPLAEAANVLLLMPPQPEAGSLALAPTTSTTMQMAFGDALAVALMERRGLQPDDFKQLHPGGSLGAQLTHVREIMHKEAELPLIGSAASLEAVIAAMSAKRFGCVGVCNEDGQLLGIITDGDLRRHMQPDVFSKNAGALMTDQPLCCVPTTLAVAALAMMTEGTRKITQMFVLEAGKPVGLVHLHDLLRLGVK